MVLIFNRFSENFFLFLSSLPNLKLNSVTPFMLFHNFCYLRTNSFNAGVGKLVKSVVTNRSMVIISKYFLIPFVLSNDMNVY